MRVPSPVSHLRLRLFQSYGYSEGGGDETPAIRYWWYREILVCFVWNIGRGASHGFVSTRYFGTIRIPKSTPLALCGIYTTEYLYFTRHNNNKPIWWITGKNETFTVMMMMMIVWSVHWSVKKLMRKGVQRADKPIK